MRNITALAFIVVISICSYGFTYDTQTSSNDTPAADTISRPPNFNDGGRAVARIKKTYGCEAIEFENWGDDDALDSTLTVCLINSAKARPKDPAENYSQLREIATQMKRAVQDPRQYKSYYIIFVKAEQVFGMTTRSHQAGSDIPGSAL